MLFVDNDDVKFFSRHIANLNVHYFAEEGRTVPVFNMADPLFLPRRNTLQKLLEVGPIIVYKVGVMTDLTVGRFVSIEDDPPEGWYTLEEDEEEVEKEDDVEEVEKEDDVEEVEKEDDEWLGVVEWIDIPFSTHGDSGSLVFAREDGIHIPLGILVGAPASMPNTSVFISLDTFCLEAEAGGLEPHFCH
jgi:hypothetical protein